MIAVISDIHGNATALAAVLAEAKKARVNELFILGDTVGYYHQPRAVMEQLDQWQYVLIAGNHEAMLSKSKYSAEYLNEVTEKYGSGLAIAISTLRPKSLTELACAPTQITVERGGRKFLLCHGAPFDPNYYIYPDSNIEILQRAADVDVDFVLMGHTHYPFLSVQCGRVLINPGSVGQPRDIAGSASWALINENNGVVVFRRTEWDIAQVLKLATAFDPENHALVKALTRS